MRSVLVAKRPPVCCKRVQYQVAIGITMNLEPLGIMPKLMRDAHRLAVTVHENSADACLHDKLLVHTLWSVFYNAILLMRGICNG